MATWTVPTSKWGARRPSMDEQLRRRGFRPVARSSMTKKLGCCPECGRQVGDIAGSRPLTPLSPVGRTERVQARPMEWQLHPCGHWVNSEQGGLISTGTTPTQTTAQKEARAMSADFKREEERSPEEQALKALAKPRKRKIRRSKE